MARLSHPNLVQFFGYTVKQNYALVEHSNLGDLHTYLLTTQCLQHDQASPSFVIFFSSLVTEETFAIASLVSAFVS